MCCFLAIKGERGRPFDLIITRFWEAYIHGRNLNVKLKTALLTSYPPNTTNTDHDRNWLPSRRSWRPRARPSSRAAWSPRRCTYDARLCLRLCVSSLKLEGWLVSWLVGRLVQI